MGFACSEQGRTDHQSRHQPESYAVVVEGSPRYYSVVLCSKKGHELEVEVVAGSRRGYIALKMMLDYLGSFVQGSYWCSRAQFLEGLEGGLRLDWHRKEGYLWVPPGMVGE